MRSLLLVLLLPACMGTQWWVVHHNVTNPNDMFDLPDYRGQYGDIHLSVEEGSHGLRKVYEEERLWVVECAARCEVRHYAMDTLVTREARWLILAMPVAVPPPEIEGTQAISVAPVSVKRPKIPAEYKRWKQLHGAVNPEVDAMVRAMEMDRIATINRQLADNFNSRNSYSPEWPAIQKYFEEGIGKLESGWYFEALPFRSDMGPVFVATLEGQNPDQWVVLGAHLDSRGTASTSPTQRAPGADDNGSGSASLLHIAEVIDKHFNAATFKYTLKLAWFCGEEQGLLGSRWLAQKWKNENRNILGMVNGDMIAYSPAQYAGIGAYMNRYSTPLLNSFLVEVSNDYNDAIVSGLTGQFKLDPTNACCSDQQSFYENGFSSAGVFETPSNAVVYPCYHKSNDLPDCYHPPNDWTHTTKVARMFMAASMELAHTP